MQGIFDLVLAYASSTNATDASIGGDDINQGTSRHAGVISSHRPKSAGQRSPVKSVSTRQMAKGSRLRSSSKRWEYVQTKEDKSCMLGPHAIFMLDDNGNNVLHLCVIHQLQEMYKHVRSIAESLIVRELKVAYADATRYGHRHLQIKAVFPKHIELSG